MQWFAMLMIAAAAAGAGWLGTWVVLQQLRRRAVLDHPNARSSHAVPTPRGGGIAVVAVAAGGWLLAGIGPGAGAAVPLAPLLAALVLAVLSFVDDLGGLPVALRFGAQVAAVAAGLSVLPADAPVFQGLLPPLADRLAAGLLWLWFVNLFNFMDGIDGIAAVETASLGLGIALVAGLAGLAGYGPAGAALAGAAAGFGLWNWAPARIFMGDVGSVPLGYLLGWLLLGLAGAGLWAPALILPLYYFADATITLARRALRGETLWRAHRSHFYQGAAAGLGRHAPVSAAVLVCNAGLIGAAALALLPGLALPALALAVLAVAGLLWYFARLTARPGHGE